MRKLFTLIVVLLSSMFFINCYCQSAIRLMKLLSYFIINDKPEWFIVIASQFLPNRTKGQMGHEFHI